MLEVHDTEKRSQGVPLWRRGHGLRVLTAVAMAILLCVCETGLADPGDECKEDEGDDETCVQYKPDCEECSECECEEQCTSEGQTTGGDKSQGEGASAEDPVVFPSGAYIEKRKDVSVRQFGLPFNVKRYTSTVRSFPGSGLGDQWDTTLRQRITDNVDGTATV